MKISVGGGVLGPKESSSVVDAVGLKSGRRNRHIMFAAPSARYDRSVFQGRAYVGGLIEDIETGTGAVSTICFEGCSSSHLRLSLFVSLLRTPDGRRYYRYHAADVQNRRDEVFFCEVCRHASIAVE